MCEKFIQKSLFCYTNVTYILFSNFQTYWYDSLMPGKSVFFLRGLWIFPVFFWSQMVYESGIPPYLIELPQFEVQCGPSIGYASPKQNCVQLRNSCREYDELKKKKPSNFTSLIFLACHRRTSIVQPLHYALISTL